MGLLHSIIYILPFIPPFYCDCPFSQREKYFQMLQLQFVIIFARMQPQTREPPKPPMKDKSEVIKDFLLTPPIYDVNPPPPTAYPKGFRIVLDPTRHYSYKMSPAFIAASKPLLTHCDIGLPIEEMVLYAKQYENQEGELDPEDEMLVRETLPYQKSNNGAK